MGGKIELEPILESCLGGIVDVSGQEQEFLSEALSDSELLPGFLDSSDGLLVIRGLGSVAREPERLVSLSRMFGSEVEDYRQTPTPPSMIHEDESEILVISNLPPCDRQPPEPPDPSETENGELPVTFPHRVGWHTDQSFRRPPPDISLFYAVIATPHGQGQTLFANGYAAYDGLSREQKEKIRGVNGLHALLGTGRTEQAVRDGTEAMPLLDHQKSQLHPLVRVHPVTGREALYLCERGQMDWLDGPVEGLEPGPHGSGADLVYELMAHYTQPEYVYAHEWDTGDLVIYDNRCLIHSATWYDVTKYDRLMWRTTVFGNPGPEYCGEAKSWIPKEGDNLLEGLGDGRWDNLSGDDRRKHS